MVGEWVDTTLGDVLTLQRGFDLPQADRKRGQYPVIASTGPVGTHDEAKVHGPGVVIGRSGSLGGGQFIDGDFWPLNTTLWVKDFKGNDRRFCYYLLKSLNLAQFNAGSGVPTLNRNHIHPLPLTVPTDTREQRAIAHILGTLDDKIELNRRMNETLEAMARALFKSWFVDYDPVRAKAEGRDSGLPKHLADLFPDGFEDSELGEIPNGWGITTVADVCSIVTRGVTPKYEEGSRRYIINQRVNRGSYLDLTSLKELDSSMVVSPERHARFWDILVNCLGEGTLGRVHLYKGKSDVYAVDQHMSICRGRTNDVGTYLYQVLSSNQGQAKIQSLKTGSTGMTMFNITKLRKYDFLWPERTLIEAYFRITSSGYSRIAGNEDESQTLATLRDTLLPKLISGDLRIKDANRFISEVL